ncbi:glycoside hydrolase family 16 protein [Flagelloscypha sp. PMI_526]|nr:glycoside hydrolase family 16 protein [Flagelloscypha sp. PMI_526]
MSRRRLRMCLQLASSPSLASTMKCSHQLLVLVALFSTAFCDSSTASRGYALSNSYVGFDFFEGFKWETFDDPTHGRVNYIDQQTAKAQNLSWASDHKFVMRADSYMVLEPVGPRGRDSVRITSHEYWGDSVIILNLSHMPEGWGTWPAFWTLSKRGPWPAGGEASHIDIIEGVNMNSDNLASLHTTGLSNPALIPSILLLRNTASCSMDVVRTQGGDAVSNDCDVAVNHNQGCGTTFTNKPNSYGSSFNSNGGGWFALHRSEESGISIWFWANNLDTAPSEIRREDVPLINPKQWGEPDAFFPTSSQNCDYNDHFDDHQIIFDLTFCVRATGQAILTRNQEVPGADCVDFVNTQPQEFAEAYWEINSLRVYEPSDGEKDTLSDVSGAMHQLGLNQRF